MVGGENSNLWSSLVLVQRIWLTLLYNFPDELEEMSCLIKNSLGHWHLRNMNDLTFWLINHNIDTRLEFMEAG